MTGLSAQATDMTGLTPPTTDERDNLLGFLRQQRYVLKLAAYGLTNEQAQLAPSVSALSVGGLIKHVALTERGWIQGTLAGRHLETPEGLEYDEGFRFARDENLEFWLNFYDEVAAETEAIIAAEDDLGRPVPVPRGVPWFPDDVDHWSVRWVLLHVIEETARHAGHADIVRESIDGSNAFALLADYETAQGNRPVWADYLPA
jgi:uncharacterized damage-inducible protein DinB